MAKYACVLFVVSVAQLASQSTDTYLTSVSAARLRKAASALSPVVATLPLGTELTATGSAAEGWVPVTAKGHVGWIRADLIVLLPMDGREHVYERIVLDRLSQAHSFAARTELTDFIDRIRRTLADRELSARFALLWLRALQQAVEFAPQSSRRSGHTMFPHPWFRRHRALVVYNEPGGIWMLRHTGIFALHDEYRDTRLADDIAWAAVDAGISSDCEGSPPCYLKGVNELAGEYLRRHPSGKHAGNAISAVLSTLTRALETSKDGRLFDPARECAALLKSLAPLEAALQNTKAANQARALELVRELSARCN